MEKEQGLSLLDIARTSEVVQIDASQSVTVYGISAKAIVAIFQRFPEVRGWFSGLGKIKLPDLISEAPDAIASVIAAGCGFVGDKKAEAVAGSLPVEAQLDILEAIGRLTFTKGFGPFVQRIVLLALEAQSANYGRAQGTKSPSQSSPASPPDTDPEPGT